MEEDERCGFKRKYLCSIPYKGNIECNDCINRKLKLTMDPWSFIMVFQKYIWLIECAIVWYAKEFRTFTLKLHTYSSILPFANKIVR